MSTGLPLVHWLGRSITPAYQRLALGPIWLTLVNPLDRTGIGVAGVGTCLDSTQPALASLLLCIPPDISIGRLFVFPPLLPQRSATCRMTVIRTAKATCRSTPYPYQSSISRLYRHRRRASLTMNYSSAEIRATPAAALPPFEDIYFNSNGVLFRNGIAIVDHRGSIIRRSIVKRPPPTRVAPENLVSLLLFHFSAIMYTDPAHISGATLQSRRDRTSGASHHPSSVRAVPDVRGVSLHPPGVPSLSQGPNPSWSREPPQAPLPQWPRLDSSPGC